MPKSGKQSFIHFDKDGFFSQELSPCIKHHYMHGWDGNRWWVFQCHHGRILTDRREQQNFCRGDKQRNTWLQRRLPDRNKWSEVICKTSLCLLVIFHNHYGQNCRFGILDSSCCVFMYRKGLNWRVLRLFTLLLMRTKTETVSRNKRLHSSRTTFLSLSAFFFAETEAAKLRSFQAECQTA